MMDFETLCRTFLAQMGKARDGGQKIPHRTFGIAVKDIDEKARSVRVLASSEAIDSYGEIVDQSFRLERYARNPVVLYGHNNVGVFGMGGAPEWTLPVGYSTDVGVGVKGLESTLNFVNSKASPMAEYCWQGFLQQSIRAVSIGFYPHEITEEPAEDPSDPDEDTIYRLGDNELFEISVVPIGACPDAVALQAERDAERGWFKQRAARAPGADWLRSALLSKTHSIPTATPSPAPAPAIQQNDAAPAAEETSMTPEEIKKLQEENARISAEKTASETEIKVLRGQVETANKSLEQANSKLATESTRANTAEIALKAKTDAEADAAIEAEVDQLVGKKITGEQKCDFVALRKSSPTSYESIVKGLPDLPSTTPAEIEKDVDAIVGKKITPAQKADFVELRTASPALFAKIAKDMPELAHTQRITPADKKPTKNSASGNGSGTSKIAAKGRKVAEQARSEEN